MLSPAESVETEFTAYPRANLCLKQAAETLGVDVCTLYEADHRRRELILIGSYGLAESSIGYRLSFDTGITGAVARTMVPISSKDPMRHPEFHLVEGSGEEKYRSYLGVPVMDFGQLDGVFVVQTIKSRIFRISEIEKLYAISKVVFGDLGMLRSADGHKVEPVRD